MADRFGRVDEEDEEESEEETFASSQDYKRPQLDPTSEGIITSLLCSHVHRQFFVRPNISLDNQCFVLESCLLYSKSEYDCRMASLSQAVCITRYTLRSLSIRKSELYNCS